MQSIADVCDIEIVSASGLPTPVRPGLLIEVPHGATRRRHFEATRRRLRGVYPDDLEEFFYVNTDVGSIECARCVARMMTNPERYPELPSNASGNRSRIDSVLIVRGLLARTFVDLNRVVGTSSAVSASSASSASSAISAGGGESQIRGPREVLTPGLPEYVTRPEDIETLLRLHGEYQALAARAYKIVLGAPGTCALILHTYAPRSVHIDRIDDGIVAALRRAYEPAVFATLPRRPDVDLITGAAIDESTETSADPSDALRLAPEALVRAVREQYARIGIEASENATYRLHESSMGYVHSSRYPDRVLCMEINRELLADPFTPFTEMSISEAKARRMAAPIAAAFLSPS